MARLKKDERVCPFCAETIKAAATRCRYCYSDVQPVVPPDPGVEPVGATAVVESVEDAPVVEPVEATSPEPKEPVPPRDVRTFLTERLTLLLAGAVLLAAAGVGALWWRAEHGSATVDEDARTQVLVSAADLTQRTLSYSYKSLDDDAKLARPRMTASFRKEYDSTMSQVRANTLKNKIVLEAVAVSSAIIKATEHKATVLVFLNQTTTAGTGKNRNQQLTRNSLVITLTRGDGDWAMSKLTALG